VLRVKGMFCVVELARCGLVALEGQGKMLGESVGMKFGGLASGRCFGCALSLAVGISSLSAFRLGRGCLVERTRGKTAWGDSTLSKIFA